MKPRFEFGYSWAVPESVEVAWGARAILDKLGYLDLLGDRQSFSGPLNGERSKLVTAINNGRLEKAIKKVKQLVASGSMLTSEASHHTLFIDDTLVIVGNTNGSHGYLYLAAWLKESVNE